MSLSPQRSRKLILLAVCVGLPLTAIIILRPAIRRWLRATHDVKGTITAIDPAQRTASVEVIDPANGVAREFRGVADANCVLTINGQPAQFTDLRVGDKAQLRARSERKSKDAQEQARPSTVEGKDNPKAKKSKHVLIAERIEVTRAKETTP